MTKDDKQTVENISKFFAEAFCIDGRCEYIGHHVLIMSGEGPRGMAFKVPVFQLNDSKRGAFKVMLHKDEPDEVE